MCLFVSLPLHILADYVSPATSVACCLLQVHLDANPPSHDSSISTQSQASPPANTALLEQAVAALAGRPAPAGSYARAPLANVLPLPRVAQPAKPWLTQQPATAPATAPAAAAAAAAGAAKLSASKASPRGRTGYATSAAASIAASRRGSVTAAGSAASGSAGGSGGPSAAGGAAGLSSRRASSSQAQVSRCVASRQRV
jgi:hypothetical protein